MSIRKRAYFSLWNPKRAGSLDNKNGGQAESGRREVNEKRRFVHLFVRFSFQNECRGGCGKGPARKLDCDSVFLCMCVCYFVVLKRSEDLVITAALVVCTKVI
jgi:hypothetical protein